MASVLPQQLDLTREQRQRILKAAAACVTAEASEKDVAVTESDLGSIASAPVAGVFVSLKRKGRLRSCCGSFGRTAPLLHALREAAVRTATSDPRFPPISPSELAHLDLEVWLLYAPERVDECGESRIDAVTVGVHGLQVVRGDSRGLLLPGVPVEHGWDSVEFLNQTCMKAGLPATAWKDEDTVLYRFAGDAFRGGLVDDADGATLHRPNLHTNEALCGYARHCRETLQTLIDGGTPLYYCPTMADANVSGVALIVAQSESDEDVAFFRLSVRQTMPLQSTMFALCEEAAREMARREIRSVDHLDVNVAIINDPAMHGTAADPDLDGLDSGHRGLFVSERSKTALVFDRSTDCESLLADAIAVGCVDEPRFAHLLSFSVSSTTDRLRLVSRPQPVVGPDVRPPGVAGRFYPADPAEMARKLDDLLGDDPPLEDCVAAMVPHAGWPFSGRIAADVLKRIRYPETVIVLGPKHTPHGTDWAVAPHSIWQLPCGEVPSDPELARELAAAIPGLELDAAAHRHEHGIEVQLPFIARRAPQARVVGVAIGGGSRERLDVFAEGLADVIRGLPEPPLLVISSDMNHFANDAETRRLDEMALAELDRLDADGLMRTVRAHHISMCGVLPAVIVLETLKRLGRLRSARRVAYGTSADTTGDVSRVVGYAGMLFR